MIVRMWRAFATLENAPAYRDHLQSTVLPELQKLPGFLGVNLLQAKRVDRIEIIVMSRWQSMDAIKAFAGPYPERAVVEPHARAVLTEFDDVVSHYDVTLEAAGST